MKLICFNKNIAFFVNYEKRGVAQTEVGEYAV